MKLSILSRAYWLMSLSESPVQRALNWGQGGLELTLTLPQLTVGASHFLP